MMVSDQKPRPEISTLPATERRKIMKPILEKKRRDRINKSLAELKTLILALTNKEESFGAKMEKADILEMTANYLKTLNFALTKYSQSPVLPQPDEHPALAASAAFEAAADTNTKITLGNAEHHYYEDGCSMPDHIQYSYLDRRFADPNDMSGDGNDVTAPPRKASPDSVLSNYSSDMYETDTLSNSGLTSSNLSCNSSSSSSSAYSSLHEMPHHVPSPYAFKEDEEDSEENYYFNKQRQNYACMPTEGNFDDLPINYFTSPRLTPTQATSTNVQESPALNNKTPNWSQTKKRKKMDPRTKINKNNAPRKTPVASQPQVNYNVKIDQNVSTPEAGKLVKKPRLSPATPEEQLMPVQQHMGVMEDTAVSCLLSLHANRPSVTAQTKWPPAASSCIATPNDDPVWRPW